jgi:hypothetical protein
VRTSNPPQKVLCGLKLELCGLPRSFARKFSKLQETAVDVQEVRKLDAYLKKLFGNARIRVVPRPKKEDSAEVYIGEEFVGVLFVDDEDDERSYNFQMAILGTDLE